jgi:hypothetical protein
LPRDESNRRVTGPTSILYDLLSNSFQI